MKITIAFRAIAICIAAIGFAGSNADMGLAFAARLEPQAETYTVVTPVEVIIVDETGRPVVGALIRQVWIDYDVEDESHEADAMSDESGFVSFPERTNRASKGARQRGRERHRAQLGVHASYGPHCYILGWAGGLEGGVDVTPGGPRRLQLKLFHRCPLKQRRAELAVAPEPAQSMSLASSVVVAPAR